MAGITDSLAQAEAAVLCDRSIDALSSQSELEAGNVQSYTIAGRSVTRRNMAEGKSAISQLRTELYNYIRGPISYIDMGGLA